MPTGHINVTQDTSAHERKGLGVEAELIKECVREVLSERASVNPDIHRDHHLWMERCIPKLEAFLDYRDVRMKQLKRREERWQTITNTAVGVVVVSVVTSLIGALAWIGSLVIQAFIHWVHSAPQGGG